MIYTIEEIRKKVIPIAKEYKINSLSIFGSYARGEATEESDIDFIMDKGELKGLEYVSLADKLEETFNLPVDLISTGGSNKKFLNRIKKDEILLYQR